MDWNDQNGPKQTKWSESDQIGLKETKLDQTTE